MTEADDARHEQGGHAGLPRDPGVAVIQKVLEKTPAPSALATEADKLMTRWIKTGASRCTARNSPKAAAAAVIDAVFTPIAEAVMSPVLGELLPELRSIEGTDNGRNSSGSSFGGGWYGYVYKDLRTVLGETVAEPYSRGYCGNGNLEACSKSLWAAMQTALEGVATEQGSERRRNGEPRTVVIEFPPGGEFFNRS